MENVIYFISGFLGGGGDLVSLLGHRAPIKKVCLYFETLVFSNVLDINGYESSLPAAQIHLQAVRAIKS